MLNINASHNNNSKIEIIAIAFIVKSEDLDFNLLVRLIKNITIDIIINGK